MNAKRVEEFELKTSWRNHATRNNLYNFSDIHSIVLAMGRDVQEEKSISILETLINKHNLTSIIGPNSNLTSPSDGGGGSTTVSSCTVFSFNYDHFVEYFRELNPPKTQNFPVKTNKPSSSSSSQFTSSLGARKDDNRFASYALSQSSPRDGAKSALLFWQTRDAEIQKKSEPILQPLTRQQKAMSRRGNKAASKSSDGFQAQLIVESTRVKPADSIEEAKDSIIGKKRLSHELKISDLVDAHAVETTTSTSPSLSQPLDLNSSKEEPLVSPSPSSTEDLAKSIEKPLSLAEEEKQPNEIQEPPTVEEQTSQKPAEVQNTLPAATQEETPEESPNTKPQELSSASNPNENCNPSTLSSNQSPSERYLSASEEVSSPAGSLLQSPELLCRKIEDALHNEVHAHSLPSLPKKEHLVTQKSKKPSSEAIEPKSENIERRKKQTKKLTNPDEDAEEIEEKKKHKKDECIANAFGPLQMKLDVATKDLTKLNSELERRRKELTAIDKHIVQKRRKLEKLTQPVKPIDCKLVPFTSKQKLKNIKQCQAISRRFVTRRRMKLFSAKLVSDFITREDALKGRIRIKALEEILSTERTYINSLDKLFDVFIRPLSLLAIVPEEELENTFGDLDLIVDIGKLLLHKLDERLSKWPLVQKFGDIFVQNVSAMKLYYRYIRNFNKAREKLAEWETNIPEYTSFLRDREKKMQSLGSYLILPVQRLPRYEILLEAVIKYTDVNHVDYKNLVEAKQKVKEVNMYIEQRQQSDDNKDAMVVIFAEQKRKDRFKIGKKFTLSAGKVRGYLKIDILSAQLQVSTDCIIKLQYHKEQFSTEQVKNQKSPTFSNKSFVLEITEKEDSFDNFISICPLLGKKKHRQAPQHIPVSYFIEALKKGQSDDTIEIQNEVNCVCKINIRFHYSSERDFESKKEKKREQLGGLALSLSSALDMI